MCIAKPLTFDRPDAQLGIILAGAQHVEQHVVEKRALSLLELQTNEHTTCESRQQGKKDVMNSDTQETLTHKVKIVLSD